jgi:hypothetical protein
MLAYPSAKMYGIKKDSKSVDIFRTNIFFDNVWKKYFIEWLAYFIKKGFSLPKSITIKMHC